VREISHGTFTKLHDSKRNHQLAMVWDAELAILDNKRLTWIRREQLQKMLGGHEE
jgi:hypothetical protein